MDRYKMTIKLRHLRQSMEEESGMTVFELEAPVGLVLADVCEWLGLDDDVVLGQEGSFEVWALMLSRPTLLEVPSSPASVPAGGDDGRQLVQLPAV